MLPMPTFLFCIHNRNYAFFNCFALWVASHHLHQYPQQSNPAKKLIKRNKITTKANSKSFPTSYLKTKTKKKNKNNRKGIEEKSIKLSLSMNKNPMNSHKK
jgi:hypothetical protein